MYPVYPGNNYPQGGYIQPGGQYMGGPMGNPYGGGQVIQETGPFGRPRETIVQQPGGGEVIQENGLFGRPKETIIAEPNGTVIEEKRGLFGREREIIEQPGGQRYW